MNESVRPGLSRSARSLQEALEGLDRARDAVLNRGFPLPPAQGGELSNSVALTEQTGDSPTMSAPPNLADSGGRGNGGNGGNGNGGLGGGGHGTGGGNGNGNGNGHGNGGGNGNGNGNGSGNGGGGWGRRGFHFNPFSGPSRVDPTLQFVQTAIVARPEQTEEILAAALRISPTQADKIILAAIRANPDAKAQILRIARSSGSIGAKGALSLLVSLFLFELFGMGNSAEAKEELESAQRRSSSSESFAAWFTTAAVALAILFDANAILALRRYLELGEDDSLDFDKVIDKVADEAVPDIEAIAALGDEFGFDVVSRDGAEGDGRLRGDVVGGDPGGLPLGGLDTLGGLRDEALARNQLSGGPARRFLDPDFSTGLSFDGSTLNLLGDEINPDETPPDPSEEIPLDPTDPEPPNQDPPPDDDPTATPVDASATEGDGIVVFTITRSSGDGEASVNFSTLDGTAQAGQDFAATAGTALFADGETAVLVTVALLDDAQAEATETFELILSDPDNLTLVDDTATATITDDDPAMIVWSVTGNQLVAEGDSAAYTIALSGDPLAAGEETSVRLRLILPNGDSGASTDDFTRAFLTEVQAAIDALGPDSGIRLDGDRLVFSGGGPASLTIFLETADDSLVEGPENYTLVIEDPSSGDVVDGEGLVTTAIEDNDAGALVWHLGGDQLTSEGAGAVYRLSYDGANLAPGSEASIAIDLNLPGGDGGAEAEDFSASLAAAIQAAIAALGSNPGVRFEDGRVIFEGGGPTELAFDLPVVPDGLVEGPENYTVVIDTPSDGAVADDGGHVTTVISDVDAAAVSWSLAGDTNVTEGTGATYTVRLDNADLAAGQEVSINVNLDLPGGPDGAENADLQNALQTALGTAIDDLGPDSGLRLEGDRLIFSSGAPRSLSFRLDIADDRLIERTESYRLTLATPSTGTIAATAAAVTTLIADTDASEILWRLEGDQLVTEGGAPRYTVERIGGDLADGTTVSVNLAINLPGGTGGANAADFSNAFYEDIQAAIDGLGTNAGITLVGTTLVFDENADDNFTFTLPTTDDSLPEGAENYTVTISAPSDGSVDLSNRLVTTAIFDNDGPTIVTGTNAGEVLTGGDRADDISGLAGDDTLIGGAGADILRGGAGRDSLRGGSGADRLEGDAGADFFIVDVVDLGSGIDRAIDFRIDEGDSLHVLDLLTGFDQAMVDIDAFIRFQERQEGTVVQIDTDGAAAGAQYVDAILLEAVHGVTVDQLMADNNLMVS